MNFFRYALKRRNDDGASAVEYGLLVAGIAALIVAVVFLFGGFIKGIFSQTCTHIAAGDGTGNSSITGNCDG